MEVILEPRFYAVLQWAKLGVARPALDRNNRLTHLTKPFFECPGPLFPVCLLIIRRRVRRADGTDVGGSNLVLGNAGRRRRSRSIWLFAVTPGITRSIAQWNNALVGNGPQWCPVQRAEPGWDGVASSTHGTTGQQSVLSFPIHQRRAVHSAEPLRDRIVPLAAWASLVDRLDRLGLVGPRRTGRRRDGFWQKPALCPCPKPNENGPGQVQCP